MTNKVIENLANRIVDFSYSAMKEESIFIHITPAETVATGRNLKKMNTEVVTTEHVC